MQNLRNFENNLGEFDILRNNCSEIPEFFINVGEIWRTTTDPSDPVFYSSCYIYGPQARKFKGVTCGKACELKDSDISSTEWKFGDQCVACDLAKKKYGVWDTPKWLISKECQNCEEKWSEI